MPFGVPVEPEVYTVALPSSLCFHHHDQQTKLEWLSHESPEGDAPMGTRLESPASRKLETLMATTWARRLKGTQWPTVS